MAPAKGHEHGAGDAEPEASVDRPLTRSLDGSDGDRLSLVALPPRYEILAELGRGGMGIVYRALDRVAGHEVALKVLHGVSAADRLRLKGEFRALSDIVHPNLVVLHDLVIDEASCFFTMEFVEGTDFASHVRAVYDLDPDGETRERRIADLARQLALAIDAVHQRGKLHCDIKPSNVLVSREGRVVLLDFGLAYPVLPQTPASAAALQTDEGMRGTILYMAPEQLWGSPPSQATDWYSYGATLHDALTGRPPSRLELARARGRGRLRDRGVAVSEDLEALVATLLSAEPNERPFASAILTALGGPALEEPVPSARAPRTPTALASHELVLDGLRAALDRGTGVRTCRLFGPSGVGKSTVMQRFAQELEARPDTLVLRSRCHPQEALAFNALDGLVDDLRQDLSHGLLGDEPYALPSAEYDAITRVFPVLAGVLSPVSEPGGSRRHSDAELRHLAFAAIRGLFGRISERYRLVAWLDDVQWGDQDSGSFLRDLLRAPKGPSMLLVLSYREEDEAESPCLRVLREAPDAWNATTELRVGELGEAESRELVTGLLGAGWHGNVEVRDALIRSASGLPFLLNELAHYLAAHPGGETMDLDEISRARTRGVSPKARAALEVLAVAGSPLEQGAILRAASLSSADRGVLTNLERLSILRTTDLKSRHFEFYHDKLREEFMRGIEPATRARHHGTIARVLLEGPVPNPLGALDHFEAAGDLESVRRHVVPAADHALGQFAFERAAGLYRRALERPSAHAPAHELYRRLGSALGSVGHGDEAARAYAAGAALLSEEDGAPEKVVELKQYAAEQFIQAGHFAEGIETLRGVLSTFGVTLPRSRRRALAEAAGLRMLSLAVDALPARVRGPVRERDRQRFDALLIANAQLAMVDYALSSYAAARCLIGAFRLGDPSRLGRALAMEAAFSSTLPAPVFQRRAWTLLTDAEALARRDDAAPYDGIFALSCRAIVSFYSGKFRETWQCADLATRLLRAHRAGRSWEEAPWQMWSFIGLVLSGELRELIRRVQAAADDATVRNDHNVEQTISLGAAALAWLALDQPEDARRRADQAMRWVPSAYTVQHYEYYVTVVDCALYAGDAFAAWARTVDTWPTHEREYSLMLTFVRDDLHRTRGRAALAAALALGRRGLSRTRSGHSRRQLLRIATRSARAMEAHGAPWATGFSALLSAGIDRERGRPPETTVRHLRVAAKAFDTAGMGLFRELTRYCLGRHLRGADGVREHRAAEAWLREQGVVDPEKMVDSQAPGLLRPR